jgi:hypothetical protein
LASHELVKRSLLLRATPENQNQIGHGQIRVGRAAVILANGARMCIALKSDKLAFVDPVDNLRRRGRRLREHRSPVEELANEQTEKDNILETQTATPSILEVRQLCLTKAHGRLKTE